ncbi:hypothetical protein D9619_000920 [Psilocybe cf. subviscida]|uniref:Uncharacterized protein n=1 Tax=Psilocybe cf. subviscida TaxID=2480587 RepID=A0A8H5BCQ4_9AGAR|nr:hypothetical protein D9619_000920 [Psilocybe cf. subviscida]
MSADDPFPPIPPTPPTDFAAFVTEILARESRASDSTTINQDILRRCLHLASSFFVTDTTTNPERGISTWSSGLNRLVDLVLVLHRRNELALETLDAASRACSECWTAAGSWRVLEEGRTHVREAGQRLKKILDENQRTYKGERIYSP